MLSPQGLFTGSADRHLSGGRLFGCIIKGELYKNNNAELEKNMYEIKRKKIMVATEKSKVEYLTHEQ